MPMGSSQVGPILPGSRCSGHTKSALRSLNVDRNRGVMAPGLRWATGTTSLENKAMHHAKRVVLDNRPYLVTLLPGGAIDRVFGPLTPGSEPPLALADEAPELTDPATLRKLAGLVERSPWLPDDPEKAVSEGPRSPPTIPDHRGHPGKPPIT